VKKKKAREKRAGLKCGKKAREKDEKTRAFACITTPDGSNMIDRSLRTWFLR
jgi:hypothetical protein